MWIVKFLTAKPNRLIKQLTTPDDTKYYTVKDSKHPTTIQCLIEHKHSQFSTKLINKNIFFKSTH